MPVITVRGMPSAVADKLVPLMEKLQVVVSKVLCTGTRSVSVFFPQDLVQVGLGEELVCSIDGMFSAEHRTTTLRNDVAKTTMLTLSLFAEGNLPQCKRVEVFITRFNQDTDGFAMCDPHEKK